MIAGSDCLIKFTIGEIFEVSIATEDHITKYGTYVSKEGENVDFNKCDISRKIIVAATTVDGESSHWILFIEDFLPFMSIPNFRLLHENNVNLYSTCVFWFLDNTYAQNILYNFSNYNIEYVQDYLKEVALGEAFPDTNIYGDAVFTKRKSESERKEGFTTLKMMWDSGDLSCFP
jgi:hypothetical protein